MKVKNLINKFSQSSPGTQLAIIALIATWVLVLVFIVFGLFFVSLERSSRAAGSTPAAVPPAIMVEPATGSIGTRLTVQGQGWPAGSAVSIYLTPPGQTQLPDFATASLVVDQHGQFLADFVFPSEPRWDNQSQVIIVAQADSGLRAEANFQLLPTPPPTETPTAGVPTATPTPSVEPTATLPAETATPTPTPQPARSGLTATANLNVRSGPGLGYPVIGLMLVGQHADVTGTSPDGQWWQIVFPGVASGQGWVSTDYVTAQNMGNVPIVQAAPLPSTPTPTPTPVPAITGWRGEYYDNRDLAGSAVLVRNDDTINLNWQTGSPAPGLPADNFSVRWTRTLPFNEGWYRFHAIVDDGVRLYVDDALVIDNWQDGSPHEVIGNQWLSGGDHGLRVEYYEHTGGALIQVWWEPIPAPAALASPPEADFSADHRSGPAPLHIDFDNRSGGIYDTCEWAFGDGDRSDDCGDTSHTYRDAGTYTVRLKVSGPGGSDTKKKEDYITVTRPQPVADFTAEPTSGQLPLTVIFTNLSKGNFTKATWAFGDGSTSNDPHNPTHTYTAAGAYTVSLTINGSDGSATRTKAKYILVSTSPSPTPTMTPTPTTTNTPVPPTSTPTPTKTPVPPTATPTLTPSPTKTPVPPTHTPTPTKTPVPPTHTPTPTATSIPPTHTPTPTKTPVPPTQTPTPTATLVPPTATPTLTPTPKPKPTHIPKPKSSKIKTPKPAISGGRHHSLRPARR